MASQRQHQQHRPPGPPRAGHHEQPEHELCERPPQRHREDPRGPHQGPQRQRLLRAADRRARPSTFRSARSLTVADRVTEIVEPLTARQTASRELKSIRTRVERELNRFERRGASARRKSRTRARQTRNRVERELKQRRRTGRDDGEAEPHQGRGQPEARPDRRSGARLHAGLGPLSPGRLERWRARRICPGRRRSRRRGATPYPRAEQQPLLPGSTGLGPVDPRSGEPRVDALAAMRTYARIRRWRRRSALRQ